MKLAIVFLFASVLIGCAATSQSTKHADAECTVCKKNADLACVDVTIDADTPRTDYNGKTYYFCSDECKQAFLKNPAKYASSK